MKRSKFSLSHFRLSTFKMGNLVPISCFPVLPGDTVQMSTSMLLRASPLVAPVMHPVSVRIHHWFIPLRILWDTFEKFITGGEDGMDATVPPFVTIGGSGVAVGSLSQHLGIPANSGVGLNVSNLRHRAYALTWNQRYRDQQLQSKVGFTTADGGGGADVTTNYTLLNCAWEKDYFTSARVDSQLGPTVTLPLGTTAPVISDGNVPQITDGTHDSALRANAGGTGNIQQVTTAGWAGNSAFEWGTAADDTKTGLLADLTNAAAVDITTLREALALQRFEEARNRWGGRFTEYLRYLGITPSDARLQEPEYVGGGRSIVQFSEVLQTGGTSAGAQTGVGNLAGHGISHTRSNRFRRFIEEHGYILTLASVVPRTVYASGLSRDFSRLTKEDFFQKELQFVGMQDILNKEVYMNHSTPEGRFGSQDRYDEYRREESFVAGQFATIFNSWHFARAFGSDPSLNSAFVTCTPSVLPFADQTGDDTLLALCNHSVQVRRILAANATPRTF